MVSTGLAAGSLLLGLTIALRNRAGVTGSNQQLKSNEMGIMRLIKRVIARYRAWRDERFRRRVDRVYFKYSGDGIRYIEGELIIVKDEQTGRVGDLSCGSLTYKETIALMNDNAPQVGNE